MKKIFLKFLKCFAMAVAIAALSGFASAEGAKVLQAYVYEDTLTVFLSGGADPEFLSCEVSSQETKITAAGNLGEGEVLVKTAVLIDASAFDPEESEESEGLQGELAALLDKLIENKPAYEEFKIVTFGGGSYEVLSEFSSDRYELASALKKLEYKGDKSGMFAAIYDSILSAPPSGPGATFCRAIVIAGNSGNGGGEITKEELFFLLQAGLYPVEVVEATLKSGEADADLAAIARIGGGKYHSLSPEGPNAASLALALGAKDYFYLAASVPESLLDGAIRQVDIGDGESKFSQDIKFPVFFAPVGEEPEEPKKSGQSENKPLYYMGAGGAFLAGALAIFFARAKRKKTKKSVEPAEAKSAIVAPQNDFGANFVETEFIGGDRGERERQIVQLSNSTDPGQSWTFPLSGELLIGRAKHCPVCLQDKSVSREQCKLTAGESGLFIVHLGQTNKTYVNKTSVPESSPLQSGDTIKFGRVELKIEYVQILKTPAMEPELSGGAANKGGTSLLF